MKEINDYCKDKDSLTAFLKNKKAVSLMISYVILIAIAITMAIAVFAWLKIIANIEPVASCDEETSITINDYSCESKIFKLQIKNNGRFNVSGFILTVGNNPERIPTTRLIPLNKNEITEEGFFLFSPALKPGEPPKEAIFTNTEKKQDGGIREVESIINLRIQPFIIDDESKEKIFCENVIKQEIEGCNIK